MWKRERDRHEGPDIWTERGSWVTWNKKRLTELRRNEQIKETGKRTEAGPRAGLSLELQEIETG